jgi:hypothetical protein
MWGVSNLLAKSPVKIPSGSYNESLRVERPQHDLVTDMVLDLSRLPWIHAYAKIIQQENDKQTVQTHKIKTNPLPKIVNRQGEIYAIENGYLACKKREQIEEEIRKRQSRWQDGGQSPPGHKNEAAMISGSSSKELLLYIFSAKLDAG